MYAHVVPFCCVAVGADADRAAVGAGRGDRARPGVDDPRAVRRPRARTRSSRAAPATSTRSRWRRACSATCSATTRASSSATTGLALERGALGVWLVGERGALLVVPGGRIVHCFCVVGERRDAAAVGPDRPPAARAAHRRAGLRDRREPRVRGRAVARQAAAAEAGCRARRCAAAQRARAGVRLDRRRMAWNIVIAGGGFGGFYAARRLEQLLPRQSARITLVSDVNFLLYTPLLPGAAAGTLEPRHVVIPLREELNSHGHPARPRDRRRPGAQRAPLPAAATAAARRVKYDQLIVALGSVSRVLNVPGLAEHGLGLQDDLRGDRAAQPRAVEPRDRRVARRPRRAPQVPDASCSSARATPASRASPSSRTSSAR